MKETLRRILIIWNFNRKNIPNCTKTRMYYILLGLSRESLNIIKVVLPAIIINTLLENKPLDMILMNILFMSLSIFILGIIVEKFAMEVSDISVKNSFFSQACINNKVMSINYEDVCSSEGYDKYYKAKVAAYDIGDIDFTIYSVLLSKVISFLVMSYIFWSLNIYVFFVVFALILLELYIYKKYGAKLYNFNEQISVFKGKEEYTKDTLLSFAMNREFRIYNSNEIIIDKYHEVSDEIKKIQGKKAWYTIYMDIIFSLISFVRISFTYLIAINKYFMGGLVFGDFTMYINSINLMISSMAQISSGVSYLIQNSYYGDDIDGFLSLKESLRESAIENVSINSKENPSIEFKNVYFKYSGSDSYTLDNISFKINPGEKISIVGDNGAGKTTIIKLLMRIYDVTSGKILLNGKDIKDYDYDEYMELFGPVFQESVLFAYTLKENIAFDKAINEESIYKIIDKVGLRKVIDNLPKGLDTNYTKEFYEDGIELSGGQKQLLTLARSLLKNSSFSILDEPTAAIDPIKEYNIYKMFNEAAKEKTVLYISHRMSASKFSDNIIVIDNGKVIEIGNHEALLSKDGLYADMFNKQAIYYQS